MGNTRTFSCFRRRPHIVDLLTPVVQGTTAYTVKWAQNFDGVFADIITCSNIGFYDDNIPRNKTELQNTNGFVRMTFDPTTFSIDDTKSFWLQLWETPPGGTGATFSVTNGSAAVTASVSQTGLLFPGQTVMFSSQPAVKYTLLTVAGTAITLTSNYTGISNGTASIAGLITAPTLLLPDTALHGQGIVTIEGTAPNATSSDASLQLDLPFVMQNFQIVNEDGGDDLYIATEQGGPEFQIGPKLGFPGYQTIWGAQASIWVRGGGGAVAFAATFTLAFPR